MPHRFKVLRVDPVPLEASKSYEVDPLEFVTVRIAAAAPPLTSNEIEYLVLRAKQLSQDEDLPTGHRKRFFENLVRVFSEGSERARLNAFYVLSKIREVPGAGQAIAALREAGDWAQGEREYAAHVAMIPDLPEDPLERAAWTFQHTVANPYLPPEMELLKRPKVMIGPAEQRRRAEADELDQRASAAEQSGDRDTAVTLWKSSMATYPTESARYALALCLTVMTRYEEAVPLLEELCGRYPFSALYHSALAGALRGAGDDYRALAELDRALELDPGRRTAALNKAMLLADLGRLGEAGDVLIGAAGEPSWAKGSSTDRETAVAIFGQCALHEAKQQHPERVAELGRIGCDLYPLALPLWLLRVQAAAALDDLARADELASEGCAAVPDRIEACMMFARLWESLEDNARANRFLDLVLAEQESAEALLMRARLTAQRLGDDTAAVPFYDRYLALRPDDGDVWNDLGCTLQRIDDHNRARACFEKAVSHCPADPLHWANLAGAALNTARSEEDVQAVFDAVEQALNLDPQHVPALTALALTLLRIGQFAGAEEYAQHVLELSPGHPLATAVLETCGRERNA